MLNYAISVDTESWEHYDNFNSNVSSSIYGLTEKGEWGLKDQLSLLQQYDIKATYFLDPMFAKTNQRLDVLSEIINLIQEYNQEVQCHIHTEWLSDVQKGKYSPSRNGNDIGDYPLLAQISMISDAISTLEKAGSKPISAFRAGNYGANNETLEALAKIGITCDSSYNASYTNNSCAISATQSHCTPVRIQGVDEYPITNFIDGFGNLRHLQLSACSSGEILDVINSAIGFQENYLVMVMHSFEWIRRKIGSSGPEHSLDNLVRKRFLNLLEYLSLNRQTIESIHFSQLPTAAAEEPAGETQLTASKRSAVMRYMEQFARKF